MIEIIGLIADVIIILVAILGTIFGIVAYRKTKRAIKEAKETLNIMKSQFDKLKDVFSGSFGKLLGM